MKVKGINNAYDVEIKRITMADETEGIAITCGNLMTGMTSVVISEEDWNNLKSAVEGKK